MPYVQKNHDPAGNDLVERLLHEQLGTAFEEHPLNVNYHPPLLQIPVSLEKSF